MSQGLSIVHNSEMLNGILKETNISSDGDQDIYPCDDFKTKMRIYDTCRDATVKSTVYIDSNLNNYGMTADNCR